MNILKDIENYRFLSLISYKSFVKELIKLDKFFPVYSFQTLLFNYNGEIKDIPFFLNEINFIIDKYSFHKKSISHGLVYNYHDTLDYDDGNFDLQYNHEISLEITGDTRLKYIKIEFLIDESQLEKIIDNFFTSFCK